MKNIHWIGWLFALIGLGLVIGGYFTYRHTFDFVENALMAQGTVTDLTRSARSGSSGSDTYRPVVTFHDHEGQLVEFVSGVGSSPPAYRKGEVVEVLFLKEDPQDAEINSFFNLWFLPVLLSGMGAVFTLVGLGISLPALFKKRSHERLRQTGTPIQTKLQKVAENTGYRSHGRHPYQILSQWQNPRTGEIHVFTSENIGFDPSDYLPGKEIMVFIDPEKPDKYYVDLSFLPKMAGDQ